MLIRTGSGFAAAFINATDARTKLFAYIESYYNTHRKHFVLRYQTPTQFEAA
jgi:transposase InsO family protein